MSDPSVQQLLTSAREGSHSAVLSLLETCSPRILRSIRKKLTQRMRRRLDSEDVAQAVWASFFRGPLEPEKFATLAELAAYVERMAMNKVADVNRTQRRSRRDIGRDVGLDSQVAEQLTATGPTPSQVLSQREEFGRLMDPRSDRHRRILELRAGGATFEEIGKALEMHPSSVRRIVSQYARDAIATGTSD